MNNRACHTDFTGGDGLTVIYIRMAKSKGYLRVGVASGDEKQDFCVSEAEYREAGSPTVSEELTRDAFNLLFLGNMRYKARIKAMRILSFGDNSERMLGRKLRSAGINADVTAEVVREMVECGYINSTRQLERLVSNEVQIHHTGPAKLIPKLIAKGYTKSDIERVINNLSERGIIDFDEAKARLIAKKLTEDASDDEIKKLLYKNGYYE